MSVVPITDLGQRRQEHGRIRLGVKTARAMKAIDTFRFTSADEQAIRQIAELYGGQPKPWNEPKANPPNQWEVITTAKEIRVFLPPDALSCWYEMWSGGGCIRRCDGRSVEVTVTTPGGADTSSAPCICKAQGKMACKPHSRLGVILPEIRFGGVWRLETKGWNAAHELPAMEALIASIQQHGIIEAVLALEKAQAEGGTKKFVVPRLRLAASALELAAGAATLGALHSGAPGIATPVTPVLGPAPADQPALGGDWFDTDEEVIDAELVEDADQGPTAEGGTPVSQTGEGVDAAVPEAVPPAQPQAADVPPPRARTGRLTPAETKLVLECGNAVEFIQLGDVAPGGIDGDWVRHALCRKASKGRTASSRALSESELSDAIEFACSLTAETHRGRVAKLMPPTLALEERL